MKLVSMWLAGYSVVGNKQATDNVREAILAEFVRAVRELLPINAEEAGTLQ